MRFNSKYKALSGIKYEIAKKLCLSNSIGRLLFYRYINKYEGGQFYSPTLRKIFKEVYDIEVGLGSYGCFTTNFRPHVKVGAYCSIAPGVQRLVGNHPLDNVSTHPLFFEKEFGGLDKTEYEEHKLVIGNDVWIGVNAIITGNVETIGDGAIIGAGAVVTKNIEPFAIVGGCPACLIKYRLSKLEREMLINSKWFDLRPDELGSAIKYKKNVGTFIQEIKKIKNSSNLNYV